MNKKGFTLLEVLISIFILSIFIIAVGSITTQISKLMRKNTAVFSMSRTGQSIIEELKASGSIAADSTVYTWGDMLNQEKVIFTDHEEIRINLYQHEVINEIYTVELTVIDLLSRYSYTLSSHINFKENIYSISHSFDEFRVDENDLLH